jgi:hypothetical protein
LGGGSALTLTGAQKNRRCEDFRPSGDPASSSAKSLSRGRIDKFARVVEPGGKIVLVSG